MNQAKFRHSNQSNKDKSDTVYYQQEQSFTRQNMNSKKNDQFRNKQKEESQDSNSDIVMDSDSSINKQPIIPQNNNIKQEKSLSYRNEQRIIQNDRKNRYPQVYKKYEESFARQDQSSNKNEQFRNKQKEEKQDQSLTNSDIEIDDSNLDVFDLELEKNLKDTQNDINIHQNSQLYEGQQPINSFHQMQQDIIQQLKNETKTKINFIFNSLNQRNIKEIKFLEIQLNVYCLECSFLIDEDPVSMNINNNFQITSLYQGSKLTCLKCKFINQLLFEQKQLSIKLQAFSQQIELGSLILSKHLKIHNSKNVFDIQLMNLQITCDCGKNNKYQIELQQSQIMNRFSWQRFCDNCWKLLFVGFKNVSFKAVEYEE